MFGELPGLGALDRPSQDGSAQTVEEGRLAGLRSSRDQNVQPGRDGSLQEARGRSRERAEPDEVLETVRLDDELADIDEPVLSGDVRDDDMEPRAVGQDRVDERGAEVDATAARAEHPLDEVLDVVGSQERRRQLGHPVASDEDTGGVIGSLDPSYSPALPRTRKVRHCAQKVAASNRCQ